MASLQQVASGTLNIVYTALQNDIFKSLSTTVYTVRDNAKTFTSVGLPIKGVILF